jgi:opacity protein-like surface antigen
MKRILLTITIVFALVISAGAQFNTNSKMVGASSSLDFGLFAEKDDVTGEKTSLYQFDLTPKAAYFIQNRIAFGGELTYSASSSKLEGSDPTSTTNWYVGPFARYYYKTVSWFVPFGEAGLGYGNELYKWTDFSGASVKTKHNVYYARLGVGAAFFLADNFSLEGMLMYQWKKAKNPEGGGSHTTSGVMLGFGFVFYFNSLLQDQDGVR